MPTSTPPHRAERVLAALAPAVLPLVLLAPILCRGALLYGYDTVGELFPWWSWAWRRIASGEFPHWNPNVLCGLPFHGLAVVSLSYPLSLLNLVVDPPRMITAWCLAHLALGGVFVQRHARALGCSPAAAALAGATFAGSEATLSRITAGELPQLAVVAWIPAALWVVEDALRLRAPRRLWWAGVPVAWMLLAGHLQYVAYGSMLIATYATARLAVDPVLRRRPVWWLGLAAIWPIGAALAAHQVMPTIDALVASHRHLGLAPAEGGGILLAPAGLLRLLSPDLLGNEYESTYVGPSVASQMPLYVGLLPLVLAACAVAARVPHARLLAALFVAALVYAFGDRTPFAPLLRVLCPPLGGFRIPSRMLVVGAIPLALLAGLGLDATTGARRPRPSRGGLVALGAAFGALAAIAAGLPAAHVLWLHLTEGAPSGAALAQLDAAWSTARGSALRSAGWLVVAGATLAIVRRGGRGPRWPAWLAVAVAGFDLGAHAAPWLRAVPSPAASMAAELDAVVTAIRSGPPTPLGARVLSEVPIAREPRPSAFVDGYGIGSAPGEVVPNWLAARGIRSVTGEIGIIPARTVLFTGNTGRYSLASVTPASRLDALGVAWVVRPVDGGASGSGPTSLGAIRRATALPLAFLAERIHAVADAAEALAILDDATAGTVDPRHELLVEGAPASASGRPPDRSRPGRATLLFLEDDRLGVAVDTPGPAWLAVMEPFAPRWRAEIDGAPVPIHPAHVMFRAVSVPAGRHVVQMRYVPAPFRLGVGVAITTCLAALVGVVTGARPSGAILPIAAARR